MDHMEEWQNIFEKTGPPDSAMSQHGGVSRQRSGTLDGPRPVVCKAPLERWEKTWVSFVRCLDRLWSRFWTTTQRLNGVLKGNILVQAWQMNAYANSLQWRPFYVKSTQLGFRMTAEGVVVEMLMWTTQRGIPELSESCILTWKKNSP